MAQFSVEVVEIGECKKNENADNLQITEALGNPVQFRTGDFKPGDKAVYIPIDSMVPVSEPAFAFLANKDKPKPYERIKAKKLRGIFSMGMLTPLPPKPTNILERLIAEITGKQPEWKVGDDLASVLGVKKFEEEDDEQPLQGSAWNRLYRKWKWKLFGTKTGPRDPRNRAPDQGPFPYYDLEPVRRYQGLLTVGEEVVIREKIHGQNFSNGWVDDKYMIKSHARYKNEDDTSVNNNFTAIARQMDLKNRLSPYPGLAVYGEVYGVSESGKGIQDLTYSATKPQLALFDIFDVKTQRWYNDLEIEQFATLVGLPVAPVLYKGPWMGLEAHSALAEGKSAIDGKTQREGFVVRPIVERRDMRLGRVVLKHVGQGYLLRKGNTTEKH